MSVILTLLAPFSYSQASNAAISAAAASAAIGWHRILVFKFRNRLRYPPFRVGVNTSSLSSSIIPTHWVESAKASYDRTPAALTNFFVTSHVSLLTSDSGSGTFSAD